MKKIILMVGLVFLVVLFGNTQTKNENVFSTVPEVNGKVVFQQFIHTDQGLNEEQVYSLLYKWGKDNYAGNPLLSGIRFNEKEKSITVSSKVELLLPENSDGDRLKKMMNYRFDASITNVGCVLIIRDLTYQDSAKSKGFFPKLSSAEDMITDSAITSNVADKEYKENLRKSTLYFLNELYHDLREVLSVSN